MGVYKLSIRADTDLTDMYEYGISEFGFLKAKMYFDEMQEVVDLLAINSELGRDASEFMPMLKRFSFRAHTIFYLEIATGIFIIRVLGQRVDYENKF